MTDTARQAVLTCRDLTKTYTEGPEEVQVLAGINLDVYPGERLAIVGSSGSGKTTLLNLLGGLDLASGGAVALAGKNYADMNEKQRGQWRNRQLGFVYQFHHLLAEFTALENAAMPLLIRGTPMKQAKTEALKLLDRVKVSHRAEHKPAELSGGERQRVALARALVSQPACVLLDEPTGNLDQHTGQEVQQLLTELAEGSGTAFIVVTHDPLMAAKQQRILRLENGLLISD
ncbi:lipoprotein-releasing system ATP-binding protein [Marinospirillum celere]|uniref:Lipoprotein-releasing system ATP-binding protein n=1 Tax=Marinospirillum celere TaxID=1122252 RepID=A0A1I1E925_9GAMM|nr:ATP-binding cassette domain-containing protein [Marinospirillum celere]SFB83206.1 lipoprotein-releasing system ATP-binding protein [Marinospirillum celere]